MKMRRGEKEDERVIQPDGCKSCVHKSFMNRRVETIMNGSADLCTPALKQVININIYSYIIDKDHQNQIILIT